MFKDKTIINWPSGASGDFLISLAKLLHGEQVKWIYDTNQWNCKIEQDLSKNVVRDFSSDIEWWKNIPDWDIIITHSLPRLVENGTIKSSDIPNDFTIINIDNEYHEIFTNFLYLSKSDFGLKEDIPICFLDQSNHLKEYFGHKGFVNVSYHEIFFKTNTQEIQKLFNAFTGHNLTEKQLTEVKRCITFYHMYSYDSLKDATYQSLGKALDANSPGRKIVKLNSLEEIGGFYD